MIDNIFGHVIEPGNRTQSHLDELTGVQHFHRREPLDPAPGQALRLFLTTGGPQPYDQARGWYTLDGSEPGSGKTFTVDLEPVDTRWDTPAWGYVRTWQVSLPAQPDRTLIRYKLAAHRADTGRWVFADSQKEDLTQGEVFALRVADDPVPAWTRQAIVYHIFLDRFYPGNGKAWQKPGSLGGFYGGTLRGVIDKLDYIQSLGVNTIWLSPFFVSSSHHGYNGSDYYKVEPRLGSNADLDELIQKIHGRGMRVLLDFVANHWSKEHFTFQEAQKNPNSPYRDWYTWKQWPNEYECYFTVRELPKINLRSPGARAYMLEVARHWLRKGFDGYRLDFAYGPSHDFWVDFRSACREVNPEAWIFGEVVHTAEVQRSYAGIMDGTLDFLLCRAMRETFAFGRMSLVEFEAFLSSHETYFPADFSRPAFLDNHDMSRFLYIAGNDKDRLRLAATLLYTLAGAPIIYNGSECGVTQERPMQQGNRYVFEEARQPMKWDGEADAGLIEHFRRLGKIRNEHPVLWNGLRKVIHLEANAGNFAYLRQDDHERLLVVLNTNQEMRTVKLDGIGATHAQELFTGNQIEVRENLLEIPLQPKSAAIFQLA